MDLLVFLVGTMFGIMLAELYLGWRGVEIHYYPYLRKLTMYGLFSGATWNYAVRVPGWASTEATKEVAAEKLAALLLSDGRKP
jgi:hypothetical protein